MGANRMAALVSWVVVCSALSGFISAGCSGGGGGGGAPVAPAGLGLSTDALTFEAPEGGADPAPVEVDVIDPANASAEWFARSSSSWLNIDKRNGATPDSFTLTPSIAGIPIGEYHANVWVSSHDLATRVIQVTLRVTGDVPPAADDDWTILVYMNADNNVEQYALNDLNEMEGVGSSAKVNIVVLVDRSPGSPGADGTGYSTADGNWTGTRLYEIQKDADPNVIHSPFTDAGERNLADPQELVDFLVFGVEEYPALHYGIVLWDHGDTWRVVGVDESSGDFMTAVGAASAIRGAAISTGIGFFELVVMNQCLNASIETAAEMDDVVNTYVASEELMPATGFDFAATLGALVAKPTMLDLELGERFARDYMARTASNSFFGDLLTCSVIDLLALPDLRAALDELSVGLTAAIGSQSRFLARGLAHGEGYGSTESELTSTVDLVDLANIALTIHASTTIPAVRTRAAALYDAIERSVFYYDNSEDHFYSQGISIYAPATEDGYQPGGYNQTFLAQDTGWNEMLVAYYGVLAGDVADPAIDGFALTDTTVSTAAPTTLTADLPSADTVSACFLAGRESGGGVITFLFVQEVSPAELILPTGQPIPAWGDSVFTASGTWDSKLTGITNGAQTIVGTLTIATPGLATSCALAAGIHRSAGLSDDKAVTLVFDCMGGLIRCYEAADTAVPREVRLAPGDQLDILTAGVQANGNPIATTEGTFVLNANGLRLTSVTAANGSYFVGICARDAAGNTNLEGDEVTVQN